MTGSFAFIHPVDASATAVAGLCLVPGGRLAVVGGPVALRQSLLLLLSTRPGERVDRPDYGCPLDQLVFEPNDATTAGMAIRLVADSVALCEPRAEVMEVDAGPDANDMAILRIHLTYRDRSSGAIGALDLPVDLGAQ